jgi:hypothetical protein
MGCCEMGSGTRTLNELRAFSVCAELESKTEGFNELLFSLSASQGCNSRSCPLEQELAHR